MKFVTVQKVKLNQAPYSNEIIDLMATPTEEFPEPPMPFKEFIQAYPAPQKLTLNNLWSLNRDQFQAIACWLCRGTEVFISPKDWIKRKYIQGQWFEFDMSAPGASITMPTTRTEWHYTFVDQIPQYYIDRKAVTTQKAYDLGKQLIEKAMKTSKIPFHMLEEAYKRLMKACITAKVYCTSPNEKTFFEVSAELELERDLEDMHYASSAAEELAAQYPEDILNFYARVFGISLPEVYQRTANKDTKHGYAIMPYTTSNPYATFAFDSDSNRMYANNLDDTGSFKTVPYTLQKDSMPKRIENPQHNAQLAELVHFYITLPEQDRVSFIADGYGYCFECHSFYQEIDGCACGHHKPKAEAEQEIVKSAYLSYMLSH